MPDFCYGTIYIGGRVTPGQVQTILTILADYRPEWLAMPEAVKGMVPPDYPHHIDFEPDRKHIVANGEVPWGAYGELEEYLQREGIRFQRETEPAFGESGRIVYFQPDTGIVERCSLGDGDFDPIITAHELRKAIAATRTREQLIERLEAMLTIPELPPLELAAGASQQVAAT